MSDEFNCTKCGACCRLVPVHILDAFGLPVKSGMLKGCGYLRDDNTCSIYENRPDVCDVKKTFESGAYKDYGTPEMSWSDYKKFTEEKCRELEATLAIRGS